jgi:hypothetical protein
MEYAVYLRFGGVVDSPGRFGLFSEPVEVNAMTNINDAFN